MFTVFNFLSPPFSTKHSGIGHAMVNKLHCSVDIILIVSYFGFAVCFSFFLLTVDIITKEELRLVLFCLLSTPSFHLLLTSLVLPVPIKFFFFLFLYFFVLFFFLLTHRGIINFTTVLHQAVINQKQG